jgi:hypothetical protein
VSNRRIIKKKRGEITFDLPPEGITALNSLCSQLNCSYNEFLSSACSLMQWAMEAYTRGFIVAAVDQRKNQYQKLYIDLIERNGFKQ